MQIFSSSVGRAFDGGGGALSCKRKSSFRVKKDERVKKQSLHIWWALNKRLKKQFTAGRTLAAAAAAGEAALNVPKNFLINKKSFTPTLELIFQLLLE